MVEDHRVDHPRHSHTIALTVRSDDPGIATGPPAAANPTLEVPEAFARPPPRWLPPGRPCAPVFRCSGAAGAAGVLVLRRLGVVVSWGRVRLPCGAARVGRMLPIGEAQLGWAAPGPPRTCLTGG
ncbi:hypothetical protein Psi01_02020 [Planobispora siamensis]|uniref:Uncharacterized protein n=1 Tax=Planobispora siamensis TaxID=936338 RepID=A0A8J3S7W6_9ACTN|nr:hypothetical protein Psi01_02020 [Planobispora siamensis]